MTKVFRISSQNYNEIGTFTVTLVGFIVKWPTRKDTLQFTITVIDPCLTT